MRINNYRLVPFIDGNEGTITWCQAGAFKGLENEYIILLEMDDHAYDEKKLNTSLSDSCENRCLHIMLEVK